MWLSSSLPKQGGVIEASLGLLAPNASRSASAATITCSELVGVGVFEHLSSAGNAFDSGCAALGASASARSRAGEAAAAGAHQVHDLEAPARPGAAFARPPAPLYTVGRILACSSSAYSASGGLSGSGYCQASPAVSSASTKHSSTTGGVAFLAEASAAAGLSAADELLQSPAPVVFEKTVRGGAPRQLLPAAEGLARASRAPPVWGVSASFDATVSAAAAVKAVGSGSLQHAQPGSKAISAMLAAPSGVGGACPCAAAAAVAEGDASGSDSGRCQSCPMTWPLHLLEAGGVLTALVSPGDSGANAFAYGTDGATTAPGATAPTAAAPCIGSGPNTNNHIHTHHEAQPQTQRQIQPPPQLQQLQPLGARRARMSMEEALPEHPLLRLMSGAGSGVIALGSSGSGAAPATPTAAVAAGEAGSSSSFSTQQQQAMQAHPHPVFGGGTRTATEGLSWLLMNAEAAELAPEAAPAAAAAAAAAAASGGSTTAGSKPGSSGGMAQGVVDVEEAARVVSELQPVLQELQAMRAEMGLFGGGAAAVAATGGLRPPGASISRGPWLVSASFATGSASGLVQAPARGAVSAAAFVSAGGQGRRSGVGAAASTASDAALALSAVLASLPDVEEYDEPLSPGATAHANRVLAPPPVTALLGSQQRPAATPPCPHPHGHAQRRGGAGGAGGRGAQLQPRARLLAGLAASQLASPASPPQQGPKDATAATSAGASSSTAASLAAAAAAAAAHGSGSSSGGKASRRGRR
ncbi:hypothetical protein HYH02_010035 [Chlamydomonas schloesseri]|uniref:Uncharacterized protein n=1 Tax=Chlamydomonas schloesseri TaxID=2026947 RepID=A0A835W9C4_9CHLO|nr:hypothetical protein HYH02_010035 [Chlamydomonas schloesseri]|eukprot:KAG2441191.1 hypothetical protein HYH02_010035 [Chlamydomonas schloesseri]